MLNFAANLSFLYPELPFAARFEAAARAGFRGCEFLFPYDYAPDEVARWVHDAGLTLALFNLYPGDWSRGDRGLAAIPGQEDAFRRSVDQALEYAGATGCKRLHILAGCPSEDQIELSRDVYLANLEYAARVGHNESLTCLIEPINPIDMPGYFLNDFDTALGIIKEIGAPNLRLQFDCYHAAMLGRDVIKEMSRAYDQIGHIQIAGCPGRHEPDVGIQDYGAIFQWLTAAGYSEWVGCEYHPIGDTDAGLKWRA